MLHYLYTKSCNVTATIEKISILSSNVGSVYAGMGPDNRVLVARGRKAAQAYYMQYKDIIPVCSTHKYYTK